MNIPLLFLPVSQSLDGGPGPVVKEQWKLELYPGVEERTCLDLSPPCAIEEEEPDSTDLIQVTVW